MLNGHGDDAFQYHDIRVNFSSNVYTHFDHEPLFQYLADRLDDIKSYPEPTPKTTERQLAALLDLSPEEICVTNGATEAIYLIAQTFRRSRTAIFQPTFAEYADACRLHEHRLMSIFSLRDIPTDAETVWICNPNNPTGTAFNEPEHNEIFRAKRLFVLDHSYAPFTSQKLLTPRQAADAGNILTLHSMTKEFAVPGIRLGYVTGNATLLDQIRRQRMPWSVNQMAIHAANYLMAHADDYKPDLRALTQERERVAHALQQLGCVEVWPSDTHMLLCKLRIGRADALKAWLADEHGLLIRDAGNFEGLSPAFFRIAVQLPEENDRLIAAIAAWMML